MTEKFRKAVADALADGNLEDEEREYLYKLADKENIDLDEARHYISLQIKRKKAKINGKDWWYYTKEIAGGGFKVLGIILSSIGSILAVLEYLDKNKRK